MANKVQPLNDLQLPSVEIIENSPETFEANKNEVSDVSDDR